jgi:GINS complex subunit 2
MYVVLASSCQVREKLQQLVNIRRNKIETGLKQVTSAATVRINNLSAYESNLIRRSFLDSLNMFLKLETVGVAWAADIDRIFVVV